MRKMKDNLPGIPGYHITLDGRVYSRFTRVTRKVQNKYGDHCTHFILGRKYKMRKCSVKNSGYKCLDIWVPGENNRIRKKYMVHTLVYRAWVGEIPEGYVIDHIDEDKLNNHLSNLQCITQSENVKKSIKHRKSCVQRPKY